jgi:Tfp pilus assembly protein PilP
MSAIAATVEKLLVTTPNVTVLERSKLSIVNKERALTATRYRLIPSVYLLDFEFNSAASPANIILKLYILNSSGKILHKLEFADCLKYNLKTVNMIVKELSRILKQPIKQLSLQSENEAQRYYQEYQFNRNALRSQIAISKLESAIALAPDNPDYRVELIKFLPESIHMNQDMADVQKFDAYLQAGRRIIEDGDNIRVRFAQFYWDTCRISGLIVIS